MHTLPPPPKFCRHCGAALPPGAPRFCIECGGQIPQPAEMAPPAPPVAPAAPPQARPSAGRPRGAAKTATVRLGNAGVEQSVIGGTVQLPTSGAVPPGLWVQDGPPGDQDVLAIYPPLRAVADGWSGLVGRGWQPTHREERPDGRGIFHFLSQIEWFPAPGCGAGLRLKVAVAASSRAKEGRERRGFRYRIGSDGPMQVQAAHWVDAQGRPRPDQPMPQIQIMAPPRIPRVSDYQGGVESLQGADAVRWADGSKAPGLHRLHGMNEPTQEHTPVGRGIVLVPLGNLGTTIHTLLPGVLRSVAGHYRVRVERPFVCGYAEWEQRMPRIRDEARGLGLDMEPAQAAEWWLDRYGHDGVIFTQAQARYGVERVVIAFRRDQLRFVLS